MASNFSIINAFGEYHAVDASALTFVSMVTSDGLKSKSKIHLSDTILVKGNSI